MSMKNYISSVNKLHTPQSEKADPKQVENSAGGFSFQVDDWTRMDRFLILGSEGGSYYATEKKLTAENAKCVERCLAEDGARAVARIVEISKGGRAPKNTPAIFALALACADPKEETRKAAFGAIPEVCRIGTHLFEFLEAVRTMRGLGKGLAKAITAWYTGKAPDQLAYQLVKYQQRGGMSHKDVLRLTRRHGARGDLDPAMEAALRWAVAPGTVGLTRQVSRRTVGGDVVKEYTSDSDKLPKILSAHDEITALSPAQLQEAIKIVTEHKLTHEMVPSHFLGRPEMWEALLPQMPVGALVRNLGRMTANGLISSPMCPATGQIVTALNAERIRKARLHPLQVLVALNTYQRGRGVKGSLSWNPVRNIVDALDEAFYVSFGNVEPTGKRMLLALDVSGSMAGPEIAGMSDISPRIGSAAMAMVTARVEKQYEVVGFFAGSNGLTFQRSSSWGGGDGITPLNISPRQRLDDIVKRISGLPFGGTDCALPMLYALERKLEVDTFVIYTDSETWAGTPHPHQALREYRNKMGIPARLVTVGMVANSFTIADPNDPGQLDVVGFDTATPNIISSFSKGEF